MRTNLILAALAAAATLALAHDARAQASAPASGTQQNKMVACNQEAGDMKGDARKAFMSKCLKTSQQDRMKKCNVDAKGKTGDARKAFMKECLSG